MSMKQLVTKEQIMQTVKEQIVAKIAEIESLLEQAKCDGLDLTDAECEDVSNELYGAFGRFVETVDYYVD